MLANSSRSPLLGQKIVTTVQYCGLLFQELSKTREKAKILSSYNSKNSQDQFGSRRQHLSGIPHEFNIPAKYLTNVAHNLAGGGRTIRKRGRVEARCERRNRRSKKTISRRKGTGISQKLRERNYRLSRHLMKQTEQPDRLVQKPMQYRRVL